MSASPDSAADQRTADRIREQDHTVTTSLHAPLRGYVLILLHAPQPLQLLLGAQIHGELPALVGPDQRDLGLRRAKGMRIEAWRSISESAPDATLLQFDAGQLQGTLDRQAGRGFEEAIGAAVHA